MLKSLNELIGCSIQATDGEVGRLATAYFDDEHWTVRYLVVETGGWLLGQKVLVSPFATGGAPMSDQRLMVSLTREQVRNSPPIDTARPVSRQQEAAYHRYYGYPAYWVGSGVWGAGVYPVPDPVGSSPHAESGPDSQSGDQHLRDATAVRGNHIRAADGDIGHVDDFLVDDRSWTVRYLVIDTGNWLGGRHVLVAPAWVDAISWGEATVQVRLPRAAIEASPEFDRPETVDGEFEQRLLEHYAGFRQPAGASQSQPASGVARLDDLTDLGVDDGEPDVRGWRVVASDGVTVGHVAHLLTDQAAMEVKFLEVVLERNRAATHRSGDVLVPVEAVVLDRSTETVTVKELAADRIAALPSYDRLLGQARVAAHLRAGFGSREGLGE